MMVATSGGRSVSTGKEEENDLTGTRTWMLLIILLVLDGAALNCFDILIIQFAVLVLGSIVEGEALRR